MKKILASIIFGLAFYSFAVAQETKTESTDQTVTEKPAPKFTRATFKSTRLINMQTTEMTAKGNLQFMISHHFSNIWNKDDLAGNNWAQLLGLNSGVAHTYLSFDYSPVTWGNIGLAAAGTSSYEGWVKFKLLRQQTGAMNIPVSIAFVSLVNVDAKKQVNKSVLTWNKFSYMQQLLIARKFSDKLSLQVSPTLVHYNIVPYGINNDNNVFSCGIEGRYKLSSKNAVTFEYSRQFNMYENIFDKNGNIVNYNPDLLALGYEINTGNHVFSFFVGSTTSPTNIEQLSRNTNAIKDWQFALGFMINRSFTLSK